jgi:hypothetical protein
VQGLLADVCSHRRRCCWVAALRAARHHRHPSFFSKQHALQMHTIHAISGSQHTSFDNCVS